MFGNVRSFRPQKSKLLFYKTLVPSMLEDVLLIFQCKKKLRKNWRVEYGSEDFHTWWNSMKKNHITKRIWGYFSGELYVWVSSLFFTKLSVLIVRKILKLSNFKNVEKEYQSMFLRTIDRARVSYLIIIIIFFRRFRKLKSEEGWKSEKM